MEIKTLAQFKRELVPGVRLETLALAHGIKGGRLNVGDIRPIISADTTGVYLETPGGSVRGSFLGFDKASDWQFNGDVATHAFGMSYRVLPKAEV